MLAKMILLKSALYWRCCMWLLKSVKLNVLFIFLRFLFTYVPMSDGARIDVTVSELYDSTYVGNPHDLVKHSTCVPLM